MSVQIKVNAPPPNNLDITSDYRDMGHICKARGQSSQTLVHYEKVAQVCRP